MSKIVGMSHNGVTVTHEPHYINGHFGTMSFIKTVDDITGEEKVYFGRARGYSEEEDAKFVLECGTKLSAGIREEMINLLKSEK